MQMFYTSVESRLDHVTGIGIVKNVVSVLKWQLMIPAKSSLGLLISSGELNSFGPGMPVQEGF